MITKAFKSILKVIFLLAAVTASNMLLATNKQSQEIIDAKLETQIWTTYELSEHLSTNSLNVSVLQGKATLTGEVKEDIDSELANQIAKGVSGINAVDNQIKVNADYKSEKDPTKERGFGQVIDDASITAIVKSKLLWSKNSDGMNINVDTHFGKITLKGSADNDEAKELSGLLAKNTSGVISVDNQLIIKDKNKSSLKDNTKKSTGDLSDKVSDTWITTKVKSTYIYSSNVDGEDISVSTKDGLVVLKGKVASGAERELAIALAKNIRGVKSVASDKLVSN